MLTNAPEHAKSMKRTRSRTGQVYILQPHLPQSTWILQTSCVMWNSSRICGVKLEVFRDPCFSNVSGQRTGFDVEVSNFFFVHAHYYFIGHRLSREQTIPTVTCGVSWYAIVRESKMAMSYSWMGSPWSFYMNPLTERWAHIHTFHTLFEYYEHSWGTMVTLWSVSASVSAVYEISSDRSYKLPPTLAGLAQGQYTTDKTLQRHLFGTELKVLALLQVER